MAHLQSISFTTTTIFRLLIYSEKIFHNNLKSEVWRNLLVSSPCYHLLIYTGNINMIGWLYFYHWLI